MPRLIATLIALTVFLAGSAMAQTEKPTSVVLVHGAFVDASGWRAAYDALTKDGYEVLVVQNPTLSLKGDVEATARVIAQAKHPVVLAGHSYGGMVITEAGNNPKVKSLVYLAAYAPDTGETVVSLSKPVPGEPGAPLLPPSNGYLLVDQSKFPAAFAAGADQSLANFMAASQVPWGLEAVETKIGIPAWKSKPTFFMVTTKDRMIPPTTQRMMAHRTGGKVVEIASSHAVMLTFPQDVVKFIESADVPAK
jgi:pimeloyl-ACP methyl ester carboxylesterase